MLRWRRTGAAHSTPVVEVVSACATSAPYDQHVLTAAPLIIDPYADQDAPLSHRHSEPYNEAPLQELYAVCIIIQEMGWTTYHHNHPIMILIPGMKSLVPAWSAFSARTVLPSFPW